MARNTPNDPLPDVCFDTRSPADSSNETINSVELRNDCSNARPLRDISQREVARLQGQCFGKRHISAAAVLKGYKGIKENDH